MPWKNVSPMEEKLQFVALARSGRFTIAELCEDFGISRKTGHKYLKRYEQLGSSGLKEMSRRPLRIPGSTDEAIVKLIVKERGLHRTWGPKKREDILLKKHGVERPPARSTIGLILKRHGLSRRQRRKPGIYRTTPTEFTQPERPNHVWTVDFKGWFCLGNGMRCDPLTVCDRYSRYVVGCHACANQQFSPTLRVFKGLARYHGLPEIIRVDNGTPFASGGIGGLSRLSVWWIEQGIEVEFTRPGKPQDNGSHERMHKDLKAETTKPPSANLRAQQKRFKRWRDQYNHERPHEALDMRRPAELYQPSTRRLNEKDNIHYPSTYTVKRLSENGHLSYEGSNYYVGEALAHCKVALLKDSEGRTEVHFANILLGYLSYGQDGRFRPTAYIGHPLRNKLDHIREP